MAVPSAITDLSTTPGNNSPAGSESIGTNLDDYLRAGFAFIKQLHEGAAAASAVSIAAAATTNIGAAASPSVTITGATAITAFDNVADGIKRDVTFSGALTLTHNATSLILPGGANITTAAGDCATFLSLGSGNWRCIKYHPAAGLASIPYARGIAVGIDQTLTNVIGSRSGGVNYTNSTGKPIVVMAGFSSNASTAYRWRLNGNDVLVFSGSANQVVPGVLIVPPGATYSISIDAGTISIYSWWEIR